LGGASVVGEYAKNSAGSPFVNEMIYVTIGSIPYAQ